MWGGPRKRKGLHRWVPTSLYYNTMYCDAFDISVWDKEYLVTVFDKVAHFWSVWLSIVLWVVWIFRVTSCVIAFLGMSCCHDSMTASKRGQAVTPCHEKNVHSRQYSVVQNVRKCEPAMNTWYVTIQLVLGDFCERNSTPNRMTTATFEGAKLKQTN